MVVSGLLQACVHPALPVGKAGPRGGGNSNFFHSWILTATKKNQGAKRRNVIACRVHRVGKETKENEYLMATYYLYVHIEGRGRWRERGGEKSRLRRGSVYCHCSSV